MVVVLLTDNSKAKALLLYYSWADSFDDILGKEDSYTNYRTTNWGGGDDIDRVIRVSEIRYDKAMHEIELAAPITVYGVDNDCGHLDSWSFTGRYLFEAEDNL